ncbi:type II toxin-antitoxin system TacA family antitoxin [Sulfitobacter sp.]|uniref:type II toxin-antitoxin system TacA family antitoxin n=1 Tax=Sulfitobacter sp. TaxID=1903071 RepID=UPI00405800EC
MVSASSRQTQHRKTKRERMELRVATSTKTLIKRAMAVSGMTAGDLAYEGARRVLDDHERMRLSQADADAFLKAVANPPAPADRLIKAFERRETVVG